MLQSRLIAILVAIGFVLPALAQTKTIEIDHPWARASAGKTGAVYMTIKNTGDADDRLVKVETPAAERAQMHIEINDNGVMKMRPMPAIDVKAKAQATLQPGGMHVMLFGLKQPMKAGQTIQLTLTFEKSGTLDVTVPVEKAGSMGGMKM